MPKEILDLIDTHARITGFSDEELRAIVTELAGADPGSSRCHASPWYCPFDQICGANCDWATMRRGSMRRVKVVREAAHQTNRFAAPKLDSLHGYGRKQKRWGLVWHARSTVFGRDRSACRIFHVACCFPALPDAGRRCFAQSLAATCATPIVETSVAQWFQDGDGQIWVT